MKPFREDAYTGVVRGNALRRFMSATGTCNRRRFEKREPGTLLLSESSCRKIGSDLWRVEVKVAVFFARVDCRELVSCRGVHILPVYRLVNFGKLLRGLRQVEHV